MARQKIEAEWLYKYNAIEQSRRGPLWSLDRNVYRVGDTYLEICEAIDAPDYAKAISEEDARDMASHLSARGLACSERLLKIFNNEARKMDSVKIRIPASADGWE